MFAREHKIDQYFLLIKQNKKFLNLFLVNNLSQIFILCRKGV